MMDSGDSVLVSILFIRKLRLLLLLSLLLLSLVLLPVSCRTKAGELLGVNGCRLPMSAVSKPFSSTLFIGNADDGGVGVLDSDSVSTFTLDDSLSVELSCPPIDDEMD